MILNKINRIYISLIRNFQIRYRKNLINQLLKLIRSESLKNRKRFKTFSAISSPPRFITPSNYIVDLLTYLFHYVLPRAETRAKFGSVARGQFRLGDEFAG